MCTEMCGACYAEQLQAEYLAQMCYENATIYISKVAEVDRTIAHTNGSAVAVATRPSASSTASDNTEDYISVTDEQVWSPHSKVTLVYEFFFTDEEHAVLAEISAASNSEILI